jgi:hypothetical protein
MRRRLSFGAAVAVAFIIGVAWEVFEFWFGLIDLTDKIDSIADLILDVAGGVVAYYALGLGKTDEEVVQPASTPTPLS